MLDRFHHFVKAEYVFCAHEVIAEHDEVHFTVYFFQALHEGVRVAPVSLDTSEGMLADGLPSLVIMRVLFDVVVINIHCILVFAALYDALW